MSKEQAQKRKAMKRRGVAFNSATGMVHDRGDRCRGHTFSAWYRTGLFCSTERRDCKRCGRIQTRRTS